MTQRIEKLFIGSAIAFLGGAAIVLKGIEAANAYLSSKTKGQTID